jgi:hypothetical protein
MNILVAYPDYRKAVAVLDPSRLGNQIYRECKTILEGGWPNHPASKMWYPYRREICIYALAGLDELANRGKYYPHHIEYFTHLKNNLPDIGKPPFIGNPLYHAGMRSRLLFKGKQDSVCNTIKKHLHIVYINTWLLANGYGIKNALTETELLRLQNIYIIPNNWEQEPNHYAQFGWTEPDNLPYVWQ